MLILVENIFQKNIELGFKMRKQQILGIAILATVLGGFLYYVLPPFQTILTWDFIWRALVLLFFMGTFFGSMGLYSLGEMKGNQRMQNIAFWMSFPYVVIFLLAMVGYLIYGFIQHPLDCLKIIGVLGAIFTGVYLITKK